jgi:hypothetical protein
MPLPVDSVVAPAAGGRRGSETPKPSIVVKIDGHYNSKVYTSGSSLFGHVTISSHQDVAFDNFEVVFIGIAATRLDFVQQFPTHSFRPFMKLRMPLSEADLPASRVFEAGATYIIPFNFVVPHQLTIGACNHHATSLAVREQHLRLPPTVGYWEGDDQAPEMAQIEYAVKARATRKGAPGVGMVKIMEGSQQVKVLPSLPEDAPLEITWRDERYNNSKKKTIRKNLFSAKTGKLTGTTTQPGAIMLAADGRGASTSTARINLEFTPASVDTPVPKINSVSGKLQAVTFFSASPNSSMPNLGPRASYTTSPALNYSTTTSIFNAPVGDVSWKQQHASSARRDSGYSSIGLDSDTDLSDGRGRRGSKAKAAKKAPPIKHTAALDIPFTIPTSNRKFFLPTFHSCLISRTYTLQLTLSVGPTNTTIQLAVPLQVGVETIFEPQGGELPSFESAMAQAAEEEADALMRPRVMSIPSEELQGNSVLPGYGEVNGRMISVA